VRVTDGVSSTEGPLANHARAFGVTQLMQRFVHELPDMLMWYNGHDGARTMVPWEERERLNELVAKGEGASVLLLASLTR